MARKISSGIPFKNAETSLPERVPGEEQTALVSTPEVKPPAPRRKSVRKNTESATQPQIVDDDMIRRRAYEIWEERGRGEGLSDENWLQAEAELRNGMDQHKQAS